MSDIMRDLQLPRCPPRTPACPGPRAAPHPLSSHPERGARSSAGPPGARPPQTCSGAAGAPRGLHARLGPRRLGDWGPAGSGLWASYLPQRGATRARGRSGRAAGRLGPPALRAPPGSARAGLTPSRPSPPLPPPPPPRAAAAAPPPLALLPLHSLRLPAPIPAPRTALGPLTAAPPPAAARLGVPLKTESWGDLPRPQGPAEHRRESPRARAPSPASPSPSGPAPTFPSRGVGAGSIRDEARCRQRPAPGARRRGCGERPGRGRGRAGPRCAPGAGFLGFHPDSPSALPADSVLLGDHVTRLPLTPVSERVGGGGRGVSDAAPTRTGGGCPTSRGW